MLFGHAARPPQGYMTQSLHISKDRTHTHFYSSGLELIYSCRTANHKRWDPCQPCRNRFLNRAFANLREIRITRNDGRRRRLFKKQKKQSINRSHQTPQDRFRPLGKRTSHRNINPKIGATDYGVRGNVARLQSVSHKLG